MSAPHARVIRDGVEKVIDAAELVPGDIIKLEAGDFVNVKVTDVFDYDLMGVLVSK